MRKTAGNACTLAVSILLSCLATAGASEQVKVVPEGGLAKDWIVQPGHALAAPGYPATFTDRGDDVCVAIGYRVQPDGTTSDYVMLGGWNSSRRYQQPATGYWDAYSQAGAAALSQWRFAPKQVSGMAANAAVDTVAVMTFRGESSSRTTSDVRAKCAVPNLVARMHYVRREENGRLAFNTSPQRASRAGQDAREARQAASGYAASRR